MRTLVFVGAFIGMLLMIGLFFVNGAPQEAAMAASACAFAIIPYVVYRAIQIEADSLQKKLFFERVQQRLEEVLEETKKRQ